MIRAVLWFLSGSVLGLPTVQPAEVLWVLMALVSIGFALWARSKWVAVGRRLTETTDRGARAIFVLIDWTCRGLVFLSAAEVLIAAPSLRLPPRAGLTTSTDDLLTLLVAPVVSFAVASGVVGLSVLLAETTRRFGAGRYRGAERRNGAVPGYTGPFRRSTDHLDPNRASLGHQAAGTDPQEGGDFAV